MTQEYMNENLYTLMSLKDQYMNEPGIMNELDLRIRVNRLERLVGILCDIELAKGHLDDKKQSTKYK